MQMQRVAAAYIAQQPRRGSVAFLRRNTLFVDRLIQTIDVGDTAARKCEQPAVTRITAHPRTLITRIRDR